MKRAVYFDSDTPAEALRRALHSVYGIPPARVYVGPFEGLRDYSGPDLVATITPAGGQFGHELSAGEGLADLVHAASELELAQALCRAAGTRALVDDGTRAPDYWILVARDGSHGRVHGDPDSDGLDVLYAFEPIAGEPDLPIEPPPGWAKTW
jgi:hypothetical protein